MKAGREEKEWKERKAVLDLVEGKENFETEDNRGRIVMLRCYFSLNNTGIFLFLLFSASRGLWLWFKPLLGGALKAKQVKVEIKARGEGFFGNKEVSLDFSSQKFTRAKSVRGRLVSAGLCPQTAQTQLPESKEDQ